MNTDDYLDKVKNLPEPWCDFRLDRDFYAPFEGYGEDQGVVREIIYNKFPDKPSISLGSLPPIISPLLWEIVSGVDYRKIKSFKYKNEFICRQTYDRYLRLYDYQRKTIKIYLVNPRAYLESILTGFKASNPTGAEIMESLQRRSSALDIMRRSLEDGNWPKLLLIVPTRPVKDKDISFTVTHHMEVALYRSEDAEKHHGHFFYYAGENKLHIKTWIKRWHQAREQYARHRRDFPEELLAPENISSFENQCRRFNINSVNILQIILEGLLLKYDPRYRGMDFSASLVTEFENTELFFKQLNNVFTRVSQTGVPVPDHYREMKAGGGVEDEETISRKKILILAVNPKTTARLRLDEETREIEEGLKRAQTRERFDIEKKGAVRYKDWRRAILEYRPNIVHFTGHAQPGGLILEDEQGSGVLIPAKALADFFKLCKAHVECVILSACYTASLASAIHKHIDYVIGMKKEINDKAAIEFAIGFYDALGAGKPIVEAFEFGRSAILALFPGSDDHLMPVLKKRDTH
jgi:hypothetical protein